MSLSDRLAAIAARPARPTLELDAPELGPGETVHVARFRIGERRKFADLFNSLRGRKADGTFETPYDDQLKHLLPLVAFEPDGTPSFTGPDDPAIDLLPTALADRMIEAAVSASTVESKEAKKPSATTRNSS